MISLSELDIAAATNTESGDQLTLIDVDAGLFALVDQTGPTYGGRHRGVGWNTAWDALRSAWIASHSAPPSDRLRAALLAANSELLTAPSSGVVPDGSGPAHTTASVTVLALLGDLFAVGQIGSCRAYRERSDHLELLVRDHTLLSDPSWDESMVRREQAAHVVTRLLGYEVSPELDMHVDSLARGDSFLLCNDAIWQSLDHPKLGSNGADAQRWCESLLVQGRGNATAIAVRC